MWENPHKLGQKKLRDDGPLPPGTLLTLAGGAQMVLTGYAGNVLTMVSLENGETYEKTLLEMCLFGRATFQTPLSC